MTDRERLCAALRKIAWAYLLLHLHFNLGTLDLLPNWGGYLLIFLALPDLSIEVPSLKLLSTLGVILCLWGGAEWIFNLFGAQLDVGGWSIIQVVLDLYFHFQLLTDLAALSEQHELPGTAKMLRQLRSARTVLATCYQLPLIWPWLNDLLPTATQISLTVIAIIYVIVSLVICYALFALRRALFEDETTISN